MGSMADHQRGPRRRIPSWTMILSLVWMSLAPTVSGFIFPLNSDGCPCRATQSSKIWQRDEVESELESDNDYDSVLVADTFRHRYKDFLPPWLIDKCDDCGWTHPTRIQELVLDAVLLESQTDVVVQSETGSGKTLAFLLPCLASIDASRSAVQALIVVPTRELGLQIARVAKRLASASPDHKIMVMSVLQGSQNRRQRAWAWADPPHVVIGTPEELCAMITNGGFKRYNSVRYVIVDEVDACLLNNNGKIAASSGKGTMQFSGTPLHELLSKYLSPTYVDGKDVVQSEAGLEALGFSEAASTQRPVSLKRHTIFSSATIPQHRYFIKQCVQNQWMIHQPIYLAVRPGRLPMQVEHGYVVASSPEKKLAALRMTIKKVMQSCRETSTRRKVLIFADSNRPLEEIAKLLVKDTGGIYWSEQTAPAFESSLPVFAMVSVLRYENSLSQRAVAMDALRGDGTLSLPISPTDTFADDEDRHEDINKDDIPLISPPHHESSSVSPTMLLRVMLSTDLAARGLDVADISHVVQFDLPDSSDTYAHRAGRTGRLGRPGQVISILSPDQEFVLERLANKLQIEISCIARQAKVDATSER